MYIKYNKVANFVSQSRGTADEYLLNCAIKLYLTVKTVTSCRRPINPFTEYISACHTHM